MTPSLNIDIKARADLAKATSDVSKLNAELNKTEAASNKAATGGKNMGQAMLQGSRAIQDLQYGIGGVLNNIEGLASAFGMGAGVAGAATVAAVALTALGPHLAKVVDALIPLDEVLGKVSEKLAQDAVEAGQAYMTTVDNAGKQSRAFESALQAEKTALDSVNDSIDRQVKLLETRNRIQLMLEDAALASQVEDIKAQKLSPQEEARQIAEARLASQGRKAGIEEAGRQTAMQAAQGQQRNAAIAFTTAQERVSGAEQQTQQSALFRLNEAEIAKLEQQIRERGMAGELTPQELADRDARDAADRAEIARRQQSNQGILAQNNGMQPRSFSAEQLDAMRSQAQTFRGAFQASTSQVNDLSTAQQAAREMAAAQMTLQQQAIARQYSSAANPGAPLFNNPLTALGFMQRTGQAAATAQMPGAPMAAPLGAFAGTPLAGGFTGGLGAPLGQVVAPIEKAAQTLQGNPLDLSELGRPLEALSTSVTGMRDNLQQQIQQLGAKVEQVNQQLRNSSSR